MVIPIILVYSFLEMQSIVDYTLFEGRGRLVPFKDSDKIALEVNDLLSNNHECNAIRKRAYLFGRFMIWKEVARNYVAEAIDVLDIRESKPKARYVETHIPKSIDKLPLLILNTSGP